MPRELRVQDVGFVIDYKRIYKGGFTGRAHLAPSVDLKPPLQMLSSTPVPVEALRADGSGAFQWSGACLGFSGLRSNELAAQHSHKNRGLRAVVLPSMAQA